MLFVKRRDLLVILSLLVGLAPCTLWRLTLQKGTFESLWQGYTFHLEGPVVFFKGILWLMNALYWSSLALALVQLAVTHDRAKQRRVGAWHLMVLVALLCLALYLGLFTLYTLAQQGDTLRFTQVRGLVLLLFRLLCIGQAERLLGKEEQVVRMANRLR